MDYLLDLLVGFNAVEPSQNRTLVICRASSIELTYEERTVFKVKMFSFRHLSSNLPLCGLLARVREGSSICGTIMKSIHSFSQAGERILQHEEKLTDGLLNLLTNRVKT